MHPRLFGGGSWERSNRVVLFALNACVSFPLCVGKRRIRWKDLEQCHVTSERTDKTSCWLCVFFKKILSSHVKSSRRIAPDPGQRQCVVEKIIFAAAD